MSGGHFDYTDTRLKHEIFGFSDVPHNVKAKAEFKKKWLGNRGVRVRRIVDEAIDSLRQELYETYGIEEVADDG